MFHVKHWGRRNSDVFHVKHVGASSISFALPIGESSLIPPLLLSPAKPLSLGFAGGPIAFYFRPASYGKQLKLSLGHGIINFIPLKGPKEGLVQSARAVCERFSAAKRRGFAGILVCMARKRNEFAAEKIRKAPQAHLISAS